MGLAAFGDNEAVVGDRYVVGVAPATAADAHLKNAADGVVSCGGWSCDGRFTTTTTNGLGIDGDGVVASGLEICSIGDGDATAVATNAT